MNDIIDQVQGAMSCELFGHIYTIGSDPEEYDQCVDCGEERPCRDCTPHTPHGTCDGSTLD